MTGTGEAFLGTWELLSRIDRAADGSLREDPALGSDALGVLTYVPGRFAAQFMKRDRSGPAVAVTGSGSNNTFAQGGYDAYFGRWERQADGSILHRREASLTPGNIGLEVSRRLTVEDGRLVIRLDTATVDDEPVTRTLTWRRIG